MTDSRKKPRVCFLIGSFFPVVGGGESHALLLSSVLIRKGLSVFVLTRKTSGDLACYDKVRDVPVYRLPVSGSPRWGKYLMLLPAFLKLIRMRKEYDIIYVCALRVLGVTGLMAALLLGKKCILRSEACGELSGDFIWESFHKPGILTPRFLIRPIIAIRNMFYRKADRFLSISSPIYKEYRKCGIEEEKIKTISNGIDVQCFKPVNEAKRGLLREKLQLPEKRIFAYSGKLNAGKGLEMLLEVWRRITEEFKDVHLLLIGGGSEHFLSCEESLRVYVKSHELTEKVTFTGYVVNVWEFLQASDYFVFPSEKEACPLAPIEAMACGLASIVTDVGGLSEVVTNGENGLIIKSKDEKALYDKMCFLLNNHEQAVRMAEKGRETVVSRWAIEEIAQQHLEMFNSLMGGKED
ncbi:glycosyltransferase family 4 protein [Verrucomicrobiota bacterium]